MVDCSQQLVFIEDILEASCGLDNPCQRLMVQESNARVQNIICGMILALLCMPVIVNLTCIFVNLLFNKRKKTRRALWHADFRCSRKQNSNPHIDEFKYKPPHICAQQVERRAVLAQFVPFRFTTSSLQLGRPGRVAPRFTSSYICLFLIHIFGR